MRVAFHRYFTVSDEITDAFHKAGIESVGFRKADEIPGIAAEEDIDFVMQVNFHDDIYRQCVDNNIPYVSWSFDSYIRRVIADKELRAEKDFLFIFNKHDFEECRKIHPHTWFLPFSAGDIFIRKPETENFEFQVLAAMNSYRATYIKSEKAFRELTEGTTDELSLKKLKLIKNIMLHAIERHQNIFDRNLLGQFVSEAVRECGVNPFDNENARISFLEDYGQILSSFQREICLKHLAAANLTTDVAGDSFWENIFSGFGNVNVHPLIIYENLADWYNKAEISLNITQVSNLDSIPQRIFHQLAAGSFVISNHSDVMAEIFRPGIHLETFRDIPELIDKTRFYLKNPEKRIKIAEEGHSEFLKNHKLSSRLTFIEHEIKKFLKI